MQINTNLFVQVKVSEREFDSLLDLLPHITDY